MEYYQAQYYNEALMHYGVKGMKWGVRRKRVSNATKKYGKAGKEYAKAYGKMQVNRMVHPFRTGIAAASSNRNTNLKRVVRRNLVRSTKELQAINADVKAQGKQTKALKKNSKVARPRKPQPIKFQKERLKLMGNAAIHPVMAQVALAENMRNNKMRTMARKAAFLTSREYEAINRDIKAQKEAMKKRRRKRKK